MNKNQLERPIIRSYVMGNKIIGVIDVVQHLGLNNPVLPRIGNNEFIVELTYDKAFMSETMTPILSDITTMYSKDTACKVVNSLLMHGIYVGITNYNKIHRKDFHPTFTLGNTALVPNFVDIYRKLIETYPHSIVDSFCNQIVFYGLAFVRDTEDKRYLFGIPVDPRLN